MHLLMRVNYGPKHLFLYFSRFIFVHVLISPPLILFYFVFVFWPVEMLEWLQLIMGSSFLVILTNTKGTVFKPSVLQLNLDNINGFTQQILRQKKMKKKMGNLPTRESNHDQTTRPSALMGIPLCNSGISALFGSRDPQSTMGMELCEASYSLWDSDNHIKLPWTSLAKMYEQHQHDQRYRSFCFSSLSHDRSAVNIWKRIVSWSLFCLDFPKISNVYLKYYMRNMYSIADVRRLIH